MSKFIKISLVIFAVVVLLGAVGSIFSEEEVPKEKEKAVETTAKDTQKEDERKAEEKAKKEQEKAQAKYMKEVGEYNSEIEYIMNEGSLVAQNLTKIFSIVSESPLVVITDEFESSLNSNFDGFETILGKLKELHVPKGYEETHALILQAIETYVSARGDYYEGFSTFDTNRVQQGTKKFNDGTALLNEATVIFKAKNKENGL